MVARGGCDVPEKFCSIIEYSGMFGDFDAECLPTHPYHNCDPDAYSEEYRRGDLDGEWLPQGLGNDQSTWPDQITKALVRFWEVEELWQDHNGYSPAEHLLAKENRTCI